MGRFQKFIGIKLFKMKSAVYYNETSKNMTELNDDITNVADNLNLNENLLCIVFLSILVILTTDKSFILFKMITEFYLPLKYDRV